MTVEEEILGTNFEGELNVTCHNKQLPENEKKYIVFINYN